MADTNHSLPLETVKIDDHTYSIEDNGVRCLLFIGSERAMLVDTGFGEAGNLKPVVESLTDKPVILVNSHADRDHVGKNAEFGETFMHPSEMANYALKAEKGVQVSPLWEGDIIDLGGLLFEVILIPGHTPGSIALLDRENRILVAGDSVSARPIHMFGDMRNIYSYFLSIEKLIAMSDAFDTIYPSHGELPLPVGHLSKEIAAGKKLLAGELPPIDPPFPMPAKAYVYDGAGFLYSFKD